MITNSLPSDDRDRMCNRQRSDSGALFQANPREMVATSEQFSYDVSRDGQKFLINTQLKTALTPMSIVLNWTAKLGK